MLKVVLLTSAALLMPIVMKFIAGIGMQLLLRKVAKAEKKRRTHEKFLKDIEKFKNERVIDEIYERERKLLYMQARDLFNQLMHAGSLSHREIIYLEDMIKRSLGSYIDEYKGYKFKNNAHRIYTLMKNTHIDVQDWKRIIYFLEQMQQKDKKQPALAQQVANGYSNVVLFSQLKKKS